MGTRGRRSVLVASCALVASGCSPSAPDDAVEDVRRPGATTSVAVEPTRTGQVTLALGGDVHFEGNVASLLRPGGTLGPISRTLRAADIAMVNLETPVTDAVRRDPKELERPADRYHFRTGPRALDVLADSGVDVVSVANNHAGDYGWAGLADTLEAGERSGVAMVGAGRDEAEAHAAHVVEVDGLEVAFLAADSVQREGSSTVWEAGEDHPGIASVRGGGSAGLVASVEAESERGRLVVVYLHWGKEYESCPTQSQRLLARDLVDAGADVVVGSHSHVLSGAGWSGDALVDYGLGNLAWYHDRQPATGVLSVTLDADGVVGKEWTPARTSPVDGRPVPLTGAARTAAVADWRGRRDCTGLAAEQGGPQADDPDFAASVEPVGAALAARMRGTSHRAGCPVQLSDLRHVQVTHRDLAGRARTGELVVHRRWARPVTEVFERLYAAGWPIARMRLVDAYGGDDDRSMAANNSSAYNCRRVAGQTSWSLHAWGAAIDLNPVQNPYVRPGSVAPPAGRPYAAIDRSRSATVRPGTVRSGDLAVAAFARIGWEWGGYWTYGDFQHFAAPRPPV